MGVVISFTEIKLKDNHKLRLHVQIKKFNNNIVRFQVEHVPSENIFLSKTGFFIHLIILPVS